MWYHFAVNTAAKLLDAMRNNPRDWRMAQLLTLARQFGVMVRETMVAAIMCLRTRRSLALSRFPHIAPSNLCIYANLWR